MTLEAALPTLADFTSLYCERHQEDESEHESQCTARRDWHP